MARTTPEWIGKTDNAMPPPSVTLRIWERAKGRCAKCERKLMAGERWDRDHITPLADGGKNVESNFQVLCEWCHGQKTAGENEQRAKVRTKTKKHLGIRKPSTFPGGRNSRFKRTIGGKVIDRQTGMEVGR
jgi:5-methylcytosine-specific restriction protein A